jgi:hypothetical protein
MALMTVNDGESTDFRSINRWSANKKLDVVLRLLRGEKLEEVSREVGVEAHRQGVVRIILVRFPGAEHPDPRGQCCRHIEDPLFTSTHVVYALGPGELSLSKPSP